MKIRPDQIEGVQPEQTQRKNKANQPERAFGDFLNQEMAKTAPAGAQGVNPPPIVNPLIATQAAEGVQKADAQSGGVVGQVESILDKWDNYAATLAGPQAGLKSAYGTLDQIATEVESLKNEQPDLATSHPGLKSIVDELETLTTTERFKFNRGDYV